MAETLRNQRVRLLLRHLRLAQVDHTRGRRLGLATTYTPHLLCMMAHMVEGRRSKKKKKKKKKKRYYQYCRARLWRGGVEQLKETRLPGHASTVSTPAITVMVCLTWTGGSVSVGAGTGLSGLCADCCMHRLPTAGDHGLLYAASDLAALG